MKFRLLLIFLICATISSIANGQIKKTSKKSNYRDSIIRIIDPPVAAFYKKLYYFDGIPIRSSIAVSDSAFWKAAQRISSMLRFVKNVRLNLLEHGAEVHIIGQNENTSDLPEFHNIQNNQVTIGNSIEDIDQRTRGMSNIFASCGEENLLHLKSDRYNGGYDILTHEFAHVIMHFGLDQKIREKIVKRYKAAMTIGLWKHAYASTNPEEYWAELSSWYFGFHGDYEKKYLLFPKPGPEGLKGYDKLGFDLLDSIYSGRLKPQIVHITPVVNVSPGSKSTANGKKTELTIVNNSANSLKLVGIGVHGERMPFATILPYSHFYLTTFNTVVWKVESMLGQPIGLFMAKGLQNRFIAN